MLMRKLGTAVLGVGMFMALLSPQSQATELKTGLSGYGGALLGLASGSGNAGSGIGYGVQGGYFFNEAMGAGIFFQAGDHDFGITSFFVGAEFLYRFADVLPGLHVGGILATGKITADASYPGGAIPGDYHLGFGAKVAYDYPLSFGQTPLSVGLQVSFMFLKPGLETLTFTSPMITAKVWF